VLGSETIVHARLASGQGFTFSRRGISGVKAGDTVPLGLPAAFLHVFDKAGIAVGAPAEWRSAYVG
jgi:multiple sugar transport system ATP-binding protein